MLESKYNQIPSQIKQLNKAVDEINNTDDVSEKIKIVKSHMEGRRSMVLIQEDGTSFNAAYCVKIYYYIYYSAKSILEE